MAGGRETLRLMRDETDEECAKAGYAEGATRTVVFAVDEAGATVPVVVSAVYTPMFGRETCEALYAAQCESVYGFPCIVAHQEWDGRGWQVLQTWRAGFGAAEEAGTSRTP